MTRTCLGLTRGSQTVPPGFGLLQISPDLALVTTETVGGRREIGEAMMLLAEHIDPFLPFGPGSASPPVVARTLADNPAPWRASLDRIEGCVEVLATAQLPTAAANPATGSTWLRSRAAAVRAAAEDVKDLHETVMRMAVQANVPVRANRIAGASRQVDIALLIPRRSAGSAMVRMRGLPVPNLAIQFSGPWPCFSFGPERAEVPA